jgi:hypothetical protein
MRACSLKQIAMHAVAEKSKSMPCCTMKPTEVRKKGFPRSVTEFRIVAEPIENNTEENFVDCWPARAETSVNFIVERSGELCR